MSGLESIKVRIPENVVTRDGEVVTPDPEELLDLMEEAGWTGDPGTGKAVLLPDGSEVLNPTPMAPPVDYDRAPDAFSMWQQSLQRMSNIRDLGNIELDSAEDAEDFDVQDPEDIFVRSQYEFEMVPEAPSLQRSGILTDGPSTPVEPAVAAARAVEDGKT